MAQEAGLGQGGLGQRGWAHSPTCPRALASSLLLGTDRPRPALATCAGGSGAACVTTGDAVQALGGLLVHAALQRPLVPTAPMTMVVSPGAGRLAWFCGLDPIYPTPRPRRVARHLGWPLAIAALPVAWAGLAARAAPQRLPCSQPSCSGATPPR